MAKGTKKSNDRVTIADDKASVESSTGTNRKAIW